MLSQKKGVLTADRRRMQSTLELEKGWASHQSLKGQRKKGVMERVLDYITAGMMHGIQRAGGAGDGDGVGVVGGLLLTTLLIRPYCTFSHI